MTLFLQPTPHGDWLIRHSTAFSGSRFLASAMLCNPPGRQLGPQIKWPGRVPCAPGPVSAQACARLAFDLALGPVLVDDHRDHDDQTLDDVLNISIYSNEGETTCHHPEYERANDSSGDTPYATY